jgi:PAS domain S-box-containing protein
MSSDQPTSQFSKDGIIADLNEARRDALFAEYGVLDTQPESAFDDIVQFAGALCGTPISLISLVERDRQWFKARTGLDAEQTSREVSFCKHAMLGPDIMVIPDATLDPRFSRNPLVTGAPHIRFYAGAPLTSPEGIPLGSLCVIDSAPRDGLTPLQAQGLTVLAAQVMNLLEARRHLHAMERYDAILAENVEKFRILADTMPQMVWSTLPDGYHDYYNKRWYSFTGMPEGSTDGEAWNGMFHPDDQGRAWERWRHSLATGEPYEIEYRLRHHSGEYRWTLGRALPMRDPSGRITRWFGTCTDIHDHKRTLEERELVAHELSHRIKNIFAVIAGLIALSARSRPEIKPIAEDLRNRVMALGRAHDFVRPHSDASRSDLGQASLRGMLGQLFAPYGGSEGRVVIAGDDTDIDDRAATPLALLFHELATNAAKYGGLSTSEGSIRVEISADDTHCTIHWQENGGPPVTQPPELNGFGSRLVQLSVVTQLKGEIDKRWQPHGLDARISIPLESLHR